MESINGLNKNADEVFNHAVQHAEVLFKIHRIAERAIGVRLSFNDLIQMERYLCEKYGTNNIEEILCNLEKH